MMADLPILWSFRRCPYAMRARLAIQSSGQRVALREILLKDKPALFLATSPKGTVPVLQDADTVIEESRDVMLWALGRNDPEGWLNMPDDVFALIERAAKMTRSVVTLCGRILFSSAVAPNAPKNLQKLHRSIRSIDVH